MGVDANRTCPFEEMSLDTFNRQHLTAFSAWRFQTPCLEIRLQQEDN
jgi:hypothetical protein